MAKSRLNAIQNDFWLNYAEAWSKPVVYAIIHIGLQSDEAGGKKQWNSIIPTADLLKNSSAIYRDLSPIRHRH